MPTLFPAYSIGHFLNQPDNPTGLEVLRFEDAPALDDIEDPHRHTFYEVLWTDAGRSRQAIDGVEYGLEAGSLFFISPGQLHYFVDYEHLRGGSVLFTEAFFLHGQADRDQLFALSFLDNCYARPLLALSAGQFGEVRETIGALAAEVARPDRSAVICRGLLQVLLGRIQRCVEAQPGAAPPARRAVVLYKQLKELLDRHYLENLPPAAYAALLHISPHHLNVVCKAVTGGRTARQVVRARAVLEAQRRLAYTDQPVAEVAADLQFFDPSYFARVFRAETGHRPAAYQRLMSEKYRRG